MSSRFDSRFEVRMKNYKPAFDLDKARRKRKDNMVNYMVEFRKNKREEILLKMRRENIRRLELVRSNDPTLQLEATTQFRRLPSIERSLPRVIEVVFARFLDFLTRQDFPQLQFEATCTLMIIASGTFHYTREVIFLVVLIFVRLLSSPSDDVREQAVWALGNVAGDNPNYRDLVLSHGALMPLLVQLNEHAELSMLRFGTWTLCNFCRGNPQPAFEQIRPALPALEWLIHSNDEVVLTYACWALFFLSDGTNDEIQAVIDAGVCRTLAELLLHASPSVLIPALRTVGNIVTGANLQIQGCDNRIFQSFRVVPRPSLSDPDGDFIDFCYGGSINYAEESAGVRMQGNKINLDRSSIFIILPNCHHV